LKALAKTEMVWLASDEDRGRSYFLAFIRGTKTRKEKTKRIVFHEITKSYFKKAIENPRKLTIT
jgi:DNA topoisomerase-1